VGLTECQAQAATVEEPPRDTCVVAGPGSGKTTVLVAHFEQLVERGIDPLRILAITFTEKAANNMRERLVRRFQDRSDIRGKLERAYVSTVDGFCARLLKENAVFAGVDPDFYVMDENESFRVERQTIGEVLDRMLAEQPERMRAVLRGVAAVDMGAELLDAYGAIRAAGVAIGELVRYAAPATADFPALITEARALRPGRDWRFDQTAHFYEAQDWAARIASALEDGPDAALRELRSFKCNLGKLKRGSRAAELFGAIREDFEYPLMTASYAEARATLFELLARFDGEYRRRKQQSGGLDFADLEEYAVRLLEEHADVRRRVQSQFDRVLMDEFQDTNGLQARLMELLRPANRFFAVGDINQSIYGFRHANPDVFRDYRDDVAKHGQRLVELVENFRSRPEILRAVETVVDGAAGIEKRRLVAGLPFPEVTGPPVEAFAATTLEMEAQSVAARILEFQQTAAFRDMAVLVRNSEVIGEFTRAFDEAGIPYLVNRGKGFYEAREVVDLMHLLRVIVNARDEISMAAVLRSPFVQASDEALLRLKLAGNLGTAVESLTAEQFASDDAGKLVRFRDQLARWRATRDYVPIDQLLLRALDECGYDAPTGPRGAANIEKFVAQARAASGRQTLAEFVEEIEMLRESKPREPDAPPEDSADAVKIMTVHAAKGLEFPIVFLAAMHKGIDASPGSIAFSPRIGLGVRWHHPHAREDKDDSFQHAIRQELKRREAEESNRLLYVAMTRAEQHLVLSFTTNGKKPQNWAGIIAERLPVRTIAEPPQRRAAQARGDASEPVEILARPVVAGQHDAQANVTSIALFADCPRRYYLSRYLGFEPQPQGTASDFGLQVHALLAGNAVASPDAEAVRLAELFRKSALGRRANAAQTIEREFDFLMEVENIVLRGQIDLWFEDRGKTVLVDYKTDRVVADEAPARAEKYALQLRLYALAVERLSGRAPDEAYVYFLRPNLAVPVDVRPSLFNAPEPAVRDFRDAQERQSFPLHEGEHCPACLHFNRLCPARLAPAVPAAPIPA